MAAAGKHAAAQEQLQAHKGDIAILCKRYGILSLAVFGSVVAGDFNPEQSDIDFLVEFDPRRRKERFDDYFGLKEGLQDILDRPVDLVTTDSLANPYFAASVEASRQVLYAA
jgi:predicted nucleotidyltransferase